MTIQTGGAEFSEDRQYRYRLWRAWGDGPRCVFIMHNPSTADEQKNDPTNTRCINFAKRWGYDGVEMINVFALRTPDPKVVYKHHAPTGGLKNLRTLQRFADGGHPLYVLAHGNIRPKRFNYIVGEVHDMFWLRRAKCLGVNANGHPKHPLYLRANTELIPFERMQ